MIREKNIEALIKALQHNQTYIRESAAKALGVLKDDAAIEPLINLLKDQSNDIRLAATEALKKYDDPRVNKLFPRSDRIIDDLQRKVDEKLNILRFLTNCGKFGHEKMAKYIEMRAVSKYVLYKLRKIRQQMK